MRVKIKPEIFDNKIFQMSDVEYTPHENTFLKSLKAKPQVGGIEKL